MSPATALGEGHLDVDGCVNFRDAGGWVRADGATMRTGVLYRADDPIRLTERGRATVADLGLQVVVDVRQDSQFRRGPGFIAVERTFHRPLVDRVINLDDPPKLEVPHDITDVYEGMIERSSERIGDIIRILADGVERGPALIHCAFGKDRTGIIVAIIQAAIGLPSEAIIADYTRSDEPGRRRLAWLLAEPLADDPPLHRTPQFLFTAPQETMTELLRRATQRHGDLRGWVESLGISDDTVATLQEVLLQ